MLMMMQLKVNYIGIYQLLNKANENVLDFHILKKKEANLIKFSNIKLMKFAKDLAIRD